MLALPFTPFNIRLFLSHHSARLLLKREKKSSSIHLAQNNLHISTNSIWILIFIPYQWPLICKYPNLMHTIPLWGKILSFIIYQYGKQFRDVERKFSKTIEISHTLYTIESAFIGSRPTCHLYVSTSNNFDDNLKATKHDKDTSFASIFRFFLHNDFVPTNQHTQITEFFHSHGAVHINLSLLLQWQISQLKYVLAMCHHTITPKHHSVEIYFVYLSLRHYIFIASEWKQQVQRRGSERELFYGALLVLVLLIEIFHSVI